MWKEDCGLEEIYIDFDPPTAMLGQWLQHRQDDTISHKLIVSPQMMDVCSPVRVLNIGLADHVSKTKLIETSINPKFILSSMPNSLTLCLHTTTLGNTCSDRPVTAATC